MSSSAENELARTAENAESEQELLSDTAGIELRRYLRFILLCLKRYVARHGHRMLQANGSLNDLYVSFNEANALLKQEPVVKGVDGTPERLGWPSEQEIQEEIDDFRLVLDGEDGDGSADQFSPLKNLVQLFHLTETQVLLLISAAASAVSIDIWRLYTFAWADFATKRPSVGFLAELVSDSPDQASELVRHFRGDSPLFRYRLLEMADVDSWGRPTPLLHKAVIVPDRLVAYLQGHPEPLPRRIADTCYYQTPEDSLPLEQLILPKDTIHELQVGLIEATIHPQAHPRLLLLGADGSGRETALLSCLSAMGWGLLTADLDQLFHEGELLEDSLVEICREALLRRCLLLIRTRGFLQDREQMARLTRPITRVLNAYQGPLAFTASIRNPLIHRFFQSLFEIQFPMPNAADQRLLWGRAIEELGCRTNDELPALLTQRFSVTPGAIFRAVAEARSRVTLLSLDQSEKIELHIRDLAQAIRRKTDHALGAIAEPFTTTLTWDDVVLHDKVREVLDEILAHARHREKVYDDWGFGRKVPYGRGLSCLFSGLPGTGKTMMAAILAQTLGREIYRVDLSRVVSKWVGETEKNLSLAFDEAERGQLILLFDEADALFSKRTQAKSSHDRFANMEINYLLQRMEAYDGVTILTTNKEKSIDDAFKRRLKFKLTFPMPDADLRAQLWKTMIPKPVRTASDIDYDFLGDEFEMSGGHIRNAVIRAAFYAAEEESPITFDLLYKAALSEAREMGMVIRDARDV